MKIWKKFYFTVLTLVAVVSCSTNMKKDGEHHHHHHHAHEVSNFKFEDSVVLKASDKVIDNYHNKKGLDIHMLHLLQLQV